MRVYVLVSVRKAVSVVRSVPGSVRRFLNNEDGPTAVEYAVMLALIIVLCIVVIRQLGRSASTTFSIADSSLQAGS